MLLAFVAGALAPSCEASDDGGGGEGVCGSVAGYVPLCDELTACEAAIVRDCAPLELAVAPAYGDAFSSCMLALGDPMTCLDSAVAQTPSSETLSDFATTFCLECGDGAGPCEDDVQAGSGDDDLATAGRIARALSPAVLDEVVAE
ncbi:MAG: hypothetical protein AAF721_39080, partial [Myxococcota bacterium]